MKLTAGLAVAATVALGSNGAQAGIFVAAKYAEGTVTAVDLAAHQVFLGADRFVWSGPLDTSALEAGLQIRVTFVDQAGTHVLLGAEDLAHERKSPTARGVRPAN